MYRCELCNQVFPAGTPSVRVVTETRPAEYPSRPKAQKHRVGRKIKTSDDPGGAGYEIAKEALSCPYCAEKHQQELAAQQSSETTTLGAALSAAADEVEEAAAPAEPEAAPEAEAEAPAEPAPEA